MAQHNVNSGTIAKLETEIARLKDELSRSEQRALSAEEVIKKNDIMIFQGRKGKLIRGNSEKASSGGAKDKCWIVQF